MQILKQNVKLGNTNIIVLNLTSCYNPHGGVVSGAVYSKRDNNFYIKTFM